jgi:hypothetical protein
MLEALVLRVVEALGGDCCVELISHNIAGSAHAAPANAGRRETTKFNHHGFAEADNSESTRASKSRDAAVTGISVSPF